MKSELPQNNRHFLDVIDDDMAAVLRQRTEADQFAIACGMWRSARDMLRVLLQAEDPTLSKEAVQLEVARRLASGTHGFGITMFRQS